MAALSVSELVSRLKQAVELQIGNQCVVGEIGSCKTGPSGHVYFTLKDARSQLQCVLYSFRMRGFGTPRLREGMSVELYGKASVYEGRGSLQFLVDRVREVGVGTLQQQFEQLKAKLLQEGLFDADRKLPLPEFPASVGLITSPTGAVIQDMRHRLESRAPWMQAWLMPVQVQGKGAEYGIAQAIDMMGHPEQHGLPRVDYLVLARGGGSLEDLWCFNEEVVARAIAACPIPIVSAIGHETDFTIADFVADLRAPTPTAAIELTTPDAAEIAANLDATEQHLKQQLRRSLQMAHLRLQATERGRFSSPLALLAPFQQRLDSLTEDFADAYRSRLQQEHQRLATAQAGLSVRSIRATLAAHEGRLETRKQALLQTVANRLQRAALKLDAAEAQIRAASPQNALQRGFALVHTPGGKLARNAADLALGDSLHIRLATGSVDAQVTDTRP